MTLRKEDLLSAAKSGTQKGFKTYNSIAGAEVFADLNMTEATMARLAYAGTQYGRYTATTAVLAVTGLYLGSLLFAPALIPFGLAAITTTWLKYTVALAMLGAVAFSGTLFLKATYNEFLKLAQRVTEKQLTNHDLALLVSAVVAGCGVVGMMYALPTMLPLLGTLGTYTKAATATVIASASAAAGFAAFFGRPRPATGSDALTYASRMDKSSVLARDHEDDRREELEGTSGFRRTA